MRTRVRRQYGLTPEGRAEALNDQGYSASGNSYISVVMREDDKTGKVPYYDNPEKCDHGWSMCPTWDCIESWSMDYRVLLHRTGAGRRLADELQIDAQKFALADHVELERLSIEDFRKDYSLSDCVNWTTNQLGNCSGRVELVNGTVVCEHCRNL